MKTITRWSLRLYLPVILYSVFALIKATVGDLPPDLGGMHATLGVTFITGGMLICYCAAFVRSNFQDIKEGALPIRFWVLSSLLFLVLFYDAGFGIHERMPLLGLPEFSFFLLEGAILVSIIAPYRNQLCLNFLALFTAFALAAGIAILGDASPSGEGTFVFRGVIHSYEQTLETLSMFLLLAAYASQAESEFSLFLLNKTQSVE